MAEVHGNCCSDNALYKNRVIIIIIIIIIISLWRSLTCTLVVMFEYMYTGPTALRDLRTTEQLEQSALLRGTRSVTQILAPVWLESTPGSHSCIQSLMLYPLCHASLSIIYNTLYWQGVQW